MERDFMGLNSKEEAIEAVLRKSSSVQWSLSNGPEDLNNRQWAENQKNINLHGPTQLTIFYKGMVNVYDDMSPEKAHAIMSLARNEARAQAHAATPRTPVVDVVHAGQPMTTSSPVSIGTSTARDASKEMSSLRRVIQSDVPQMREASLARFLQKRRERVMASAPYSSKPASSSAPNKDDHK
ncbi:putative transcription factor TIFY family [Helianthus annuus]|nr:putative transcription factor TIFY family [Helianthus annuus]KAJ0506674.1 putative transcription factor TIFY family [Helianthus annuus]KAJ0679564.1 putative transcription factor TIFY family [Helianthus annuus]KAJ0864240.1 putative transcription factor TIFY family [Helianthus annuus]KAJ0868160.1 putative transcription factor TIFY family [Helianthus annuus]